MTEQMYTNISILIYILCAKHMNKHIPRVSKECFLEAFKYLKTSKQHPFETPGLNNTVHLVSRGSEPLEQAELKPPQSLWRVKKNRKHTGYRPAVKRGLAKETIDQLSFFFLTAMGTLCSCWKLFFISSFSLFGVSLICLVSC